MVDFCCKEFAEIDLKLNNAKSTCMRIGPRWHKPCSPILTDVGPICWVSKTTYLGVTIVAGPIFRVSLDDCKSNFYASFNAIYSQLGKLNNIFVTLELITSIALPCLMYAVESLPFKKSFLKSLEHPWTRVFNRVIQYV